MKNELSFSHFLYTGPRGGWQRTCVMTSSSSTAWEMPSQLLPQSGLNQLKKRKLFFSKNKGMKFPCFWKNILFMVPGTLESNLHECQDLIFFILYIVFCIFVHLSTPDCEFSADKLILSLFSLIYQRIALYVQWDRHYTKCFLNIKTHLILITALWFSDFYYLSFSD